MKMHNIKPKKEEELGLMVRDGKKGKERKIYPTVRIEHEHFPESKAWQPGEKHHIYIYTHVVGNSQSRFQNENEYEIHKIGADDEDDYKHEESKDGEEDAGEDKKDISHDHADNI